jgi:hypothetical protein
MGRLLFTMVNMLWETGHIPDRLLHALVISLHKLERTQV